ncbi:hypothetical protein PPYR_13257 [Photinus pyralis]|uniref:Clusterin-associated protein 1 n=1 Tax=Photinus pyralis TaxID=7054 RepID=A0A5N4A8K4_PHOPY|nr:clusterin-associated protein 1 [Photinus pyralis]XP_031354624.1 clusterin-associated protein 1 [Photinus pyralis]KAB0793637.1 hypothetical protein PPYR_13257 [Photinus pyralis]
MSYRDVRNVIEMLRALGYPKLVSMESFRKPNFPLVADVLVWLSKRFDDDSDMIAEFETEEQRIALIRNIAQFMALKANVKLNTKRLYQADGYSVKELLKITSLLYSALKENALNMTDEESVRNLDLGDLEISYNANDFKRSRQLASEITSTGAKLYDLLGKEVDIRALRQISAGRQYEVSEVENGIKEAIDAIRKEMVETKQSIENISATESSLDSKIEKRKVEIDRYDKRLQTLKKVRPAFLEEFIELEAELEKLFVQYSVRVRTLNHLERLVHNAEKSHLERQHLSVPEKIMETVTFEGDSNDSFNLEEEKDDANLKMGAKQERPRARTGGRSKISRTAKPLGTLNPLGSASSAEESSDTDTDDLLLDGDEPELPQSDDDSLGLELSSIEKTIPQGRSSTSKTQVNSDDDF